MSARNDMEVLNELFKRELFTSFALYYFPLMILMSAIVINVDFLKRHAGTVAPIFVILFPAVVSVAIALIRVKFVHRIDYKPNLKNFFLFLSIISVVFLIQAVSYSILQHPDQINVAMYTAVSILSYTLYRLSKGKVNCRTVAKMLALVSPLFILVWFVFAVVNKVLYSFITLASWIFLFSLSLYVLKRKGSG